MKCIGGSVDIQVGHSKKWVRRMLWIDHVDRGFIFTVYILGRIRGGYYMLRSDGTLLYGGQYWRHIKPPEGYELYKFGDGNAVRVRDIAEATRQRLGVE